LRILEKLIKSKVINIAGFLLSITLILFLGYEFYISKGAIYLFNFSLSQYSLISVSIIIYCICIFLSSFNWMLLFNQPNNMKILNAHFLTIFWKYLPSNFLHFVGRHFYLKSIVGHKKILTSNMLEIFFLASSAIILFLSSMMFFNMELPYIGHITYIQIFFFFFFFVLINFLFIFKRKLFDYKKLLVINFSYLFFHTLSSLGFVFLWIVFIDSDINLIVTLKVGAIYLVGWIFGFIAIGSPGGIGVREGVYLILFEPMVDSEGVLLAFLLLARISLVLAESSMFFIAYYLRDK
jgi:glycosyltransferase 2 family protein